MMHGRDREEGFIDFHTHLIPEADDGAATLDEAVQMAKALCALHVQAAVATPHYAPGTPCSGAGYIRLVRRSHALLAERLERENVPLTLHQGFEVKASEETMYCGIFGDLAIRDAGCILLEAPFSGEAEWLEELVYTLHVSGCVPVLAHPERCQCLGGDIQRLERLAREGAVMQVNIASLAGAYGGQARRNAQAVLRSGFRTVLGTDIHRLDQIPSMREGLGRIGKLLRSADHAEALRGAARSLLGGRSHQGRLQEFE